MVLLVQPLGQLVLLLLLLLGTLQPFLALAAVVCQLLLVPMLSQDLWPVLPRCVLFHVVLALVLLLLALEVVLLPACAGLDLALVLLLPEQSLLLLPVAAGLRLALVLLLLRL